MAGSASAGSAARRPSADKVSVRDKANRTTTRSTMRDQLLRGIATLGAVFEQIARLAVESFANLVERIDPLRELLRTHLAFGQHHVEVHDDAHGWSHDAGVVVGDLHCHLENMADRKH